MARRTRSELPDGAFHVISHAVADELLFWDDVDYKRYLGLLQQTIERHGWTLLTFALMGNHMHLLVIATTRNLSVGLWWLNWNYAEHVQRRHHPRRGYVFDGRPKTPPIKDEPYLFAVLRYIARNPVKHGFCAQPEEYRWSAHRAILGQSPAIPFVATDQVLKLFSEDPGRARERYAAFVLGPHPQEHEDVRRSAEGVRADRPPLVEILADGGSVQAIRSAHLEWGYSMRAIAAALGVGRMTISRRVRGSR